MAAGGAPVKHLEFVDLKPDDPAMPGTGFARASDHTGPGHDDRGLRDQNDKAAGRHPIGRLILQVQGISKRTDVVG